MADNHEFMNLLKSDLDLFADNVYCFSPAGDVKTLPVGSCTHRLLPIPSQCGRLTRWSGEVNGKLVPIETELHNGDRVEIITSPQNSEGPSRDWLKIAKSSQASRINQWFRQQNKTDNIVKGKEMLTFMQS